MQPTNGAALLEQVVLELVRSESISLSAACGCIRTAYTSKVTSLAMTDLYCAGFFCRVLVCCAKEELGGCPLGDQYEDRLRGLYASCSVPQLDLLPEVSLLAHPFVSVACISFRRGSSGPHEEWPARPVCCMQRESAESLVSDGSACITAMMYSPVYIIA